MATIKLPFGKEQVTVDINDERLGGVLVSKAHDYTPEYSEVELVKNAMEHPIHSPKLRELAKGKKNIVMIASDHTRPVPSRVFASAIIDEIKAGNPEAELTILIATGFHRPTTREELSYKFGEEFVNREDVHFVIHKSHDYEDMVELGVLPSGGHRRRARRVWCPTWSG